VLYTRVAVAACSWSKSRQGIESQFAVNYLGHFALTLRLLPELAKRGSEGHKSRIVNVASVLHRVRRRRVTEFDSCLENSEGGRVGWRRGIRLWSWRVRGEGSHT
jgi:NAD(P)-dependent dehydrogenase (short-subunit alcohol dehydrogenase family)